MSSCLATPPSPASLSLLPMVHPPWALDAAFKGTGIGQLGIGPYTKFPCVSKGAQQLARTTIAAARRFGSDRGYTGHVADIINATVLTHTGPRPVQLIDTATGTHRWAERYDRELHDAFAIQDEVVRAIVTTLAAHVNRAETERALLKPPAAWEAYEYYLRGAEAYFLHVTRRTKASLYDARRLLEQSLAIDPNYARAAAMLSRTHFHSYVHPFDDDYLSPPALDRALELAQTAVRLDPRLPQARTELGNALLSKGQHDAAILEFERAFALNPNFIDYRYAGAL